MMGSRTSNRLLKVDKSFAAPLFPERVPFLKEGSWEIYGRPNINATQNSPQSTIGKKEASLVACRILVIETSTSSQ